jgi:hypothetical protein
MSTDLTSLPPIQTALTASELRRMPKDRRDAIMEVAATFAEDLYRNDPSLTDFEAFEAEDPDGDGKATTQG